MPKFRIIVATDEGQALAQLAKIEPAWGRPILAGYYEQLNFTRASEELGAPDSFSMTDADGELFVMVLERG